MQRKLIAQLMRKISLVYQSDIEFLKVTPERMTLPIKALLPIIRSRLFGPISTILPGISREQRNGILTLLSVYAPGKLDSGPDLFHFTQTQTV